jgi:hypothetical protein
VLIQLVSIHRQIQAFNLYLFRRYRLVRAESVVVVVCIGGCPFWLLAGRLDAGQMVNVLACDLASEVGSASDVRLLAALIFCCREVYR